MFPKIHKKENLSRPVVTSVDCHTTKISKYVDHLLQPHVKELRSYVKISRDFMRKINNLERIPENRIFVTMDVRSLYTKIPNNECIKAVETTSKRKPFQQEFHYISPPCFNCKQFYFQLPKLLTN